MQVSHHAALAFVAAVSFCWPGFAAEPNAPTALITQTESLRFSVEDRLQASPPSRKAERDALLKYYAAPDQALLWVDQNGVTTRGKAVIAEIGKADDYGLRASDYSLPNTDESPTISRPPIGSPMLRSKSVTPCSTMRVTHEVAGLIRNA